MRLECVFDGSACTFRLLWAVGKVLTALNVFCNSGWKTGGGSLVNLELACGKIALNVSENILAVTAPGVCSSSGLHPVFGGVCWFTHISTCSCTQGLICKNQKCLFKGNGPQCQGSLNFCVILAIKKITLWCCSVGQHWMDTASECASCFWVVRVSWSWTALIFVNIDASLTSVY